MLHLVNVYTIHCSKGDRLGDVSYLYQMYILCGPPYLIHFESLPVTSVSLSFLVP